MGQITAAPVRRASTRRDYDHKAKWLDVEAIISGQMWLYVAEGKGLKAGRVLSKIRAMVGK